MKAATAICGDMRRMFDEVVSEYKDLFGFDLSYMQFKVDSQPVYADGEPCYEHDSDECAGGWTQLGWIRLNPDMKSVMDRYGIACRGSDDIEQFTKAVVAHELAHEVWHNIADDQFKEEILDDARRQSFSTAYLDTVAPNKLPEETFCEYLAERLRKMTRKGKCCESRKRMRFWAYMPGEAFSKDGFLAEGKHWPADYIKTGVNLIKASPLGRQPWYADSYIQQDVETFAGEFGPLSHKNSSLGFFSTIIKWFIAYAGASREKYQEFIERKLDGIIGALQTIVNDQAYGKIKDDIKQKWTFKQFEELQKKIAAEAKASSDEKLKNVVAKDDYSLIPIYSYEELHKMFGGRLTGYKGQSEWCHANGKSTYSSWTKNGTQMFFVLAKKGWKQIKAPDTGSDAYDDYGLSLIAILVDVATSSLLNETLRWNHVIEPSLTNPGATVDKAFKNSWGELSQAVGMDVKAVCEKECRRLKQEMEKKAAVANKQVEDILRGKTGIDEYTIPDRLKSRLTKIVIPGTVTSIGKYAFYGCFSLTSVTIPDSVTSIGYSAFYGCSGLTSATIGDSVTSIGNSAFYGCTELMRVTIGDSVTSIGNNAFLNCRRLTSVTIPDSVTSIGNNAFEGCNGLTSATIGDSVTSIGPSAFWGCSGLTSAAIPDSVASIGGYAFHSCSGLTSVAIGNGVRSIGPRAFYDCSNLANVVFKGKTPDEVKAMDDYPFGIGDESIIMCGSGLGESKQAYLQKHKGEIDAKKTVDAFWRIKNRLSAPENDIDWWIKKPFADLKRFVQGYSPANKRQRRDIDYREQALDNDAKQLGAKDGYEIWYVPTYEAMRVLGRFYKGRSAKWCVASDDPDFWFDNHDEDEFVLLIRERPKNDEFDKIAVQMPGHGRYYNEDSIVPWDLENEDWTFTDDGLIYYAWQLFKDNGELREQYYAAD